jgi:predicted permease
MGTFLQDLQYALRSVTRAPLVTCLMVLALSVGIGLNAGMFTMIAGFWFRARVEKDPNSFVQVLPKYNSTQYGTGGFFSSSVADYTAYRSDPRSLIEVAAWSEVSATLDDSGERLLPLLVTPNFFALYGLDRPKFGRLFRPEECSTPGAAPVAIISEELWKRQYAADPQILGRVLRINHHPFTVVGVAPAKFPGRLKDGVWIPYTMQPQFYNGEDYFQKSNSPWLVVEGRLRPGYSRSDAQLELSLIANRQDRLVPGRITTLSLTNGSFIEAPEARSLGFVVVPLIMGPMVLVLLAACTNVMLLQLSRSAGRRGEIAIRLALGAERTRLLRMLTTEGMLLAAAAGTISIYLAYRIPEIVWTFLLPQAPYYPMKPDWGVFAFLAGVTLLAGCVAGLPPASESLKIDLVTALKGREASSTAHSRLRGILIITQVAMSFVLVAAGVLFARLRYNMTLADPGFETRQVLMVPLNIAVPPYTEDSAWSFYRALEQRVREVPDVRFVSYSSLVPFGDSGLDEIRLPDQAKGQGRQVSVDVVSTDFFETLGIPMVRGRAFHSSDVGSEESASITVVSQAFARAFWNGEDPVGKVVKMRDDKQMIVVGVAKDTRSQNYGVLDGPRLYMLQEPRSFGGPLMVRFDGEARPISQAIQKTVSGLDAEQMVVPLTLRSIINKKAEMIGRFADIILFMACVAVLLAVSGVYGVIAFSMSQRTREFGIRMALGATRGRVVGSVLSWGARQITVGLLLGLLLAVPAAWAWARLTKGSPFQSGVFDFSVYGLTTILLLGVASVATYIPARRATRLDPMVALRHE